MESHRAIDPRELGGSEIYDILCSIVVPRPIALVSTVDANGAANLAPFSFFTVGGTNPPSLCFSITLDMQAQEKQTLRNIRETREFTVHQVTRELAEIMEASADGPTDFGAIGLTIVPGESVRTPRILEVTAALECGLEQVVEHGNGPGSARYVIGSVCRVFLSEGSSPIIARIAGRRYLDIGTGEIFEISGSNKPARSS